MILARLAKGEASVMELAERTRFQRLDDLLEELEEKHEQESPTYGASDAAWRFTMPVCEIDLRVGGKYRYVTRGPGGAEFGFARLGEVARGLAVAGSAAQRTPLLDRTP